MPGFVELHTDALEAHYKPRPRVRWSPDAAVQQHDAQVAASGITTVFDALRVGLDQENDMGRERHGGARRRHRTRQRDRAGCAPTTSSICAAKCRRRIASRASAAREPSAGETGLADGPRAGAAAVPEHRCSARLLSGQAQDERRRCSRRSSSGAMSSRRPIAPAHRNAITQFCREHGITIGEP